MAPPDPEIAPAPTPEAGAAAAAPMGGDDEGAEGEGPAASVLCTVMKNSDGTFTLIAGDEPEAGGEAPVEGEQPTGAEDQTFDAPGALLKGILELIKASGSDEEEGFDAGFNADKAPTPGKDMPQKY